LDIGCRDLAVIMALNLREEDTAYVDDCGWTANAELLLVGLYAPGVMGLLGLPGVSGTTLRVDRAAVVVVAVWEGGVEGVEACAKEPAGGSAGSEEDGGGGAMRARSGEQRKQGS
jgi:hypothetical protein